MRGQAKGQMEVEEWKWRDYDLICCLPRATDRYVVTSWYLDIKIEIEIKMKKINGGRLF